MADALARTDDLYHYTSAGVALDSILAQMRLRLGLFEATNDPRESHPRYPPLSGAAPDEGEIWRLWQEADQLLRRTAKVACLTIDYELPEDAIDRHAQRGYAHPALWAHYGGGHSGVCLRFSRKALIERLHQELAPRGDLYHGEVTYSYDTFGPADLELLHLEQIAEFGLDAVVAEFIQRYHRDLFFRKHGDWASEREYRWIHRSSEPLPVDVDVAGCVTGIVLGDAFPVARVPAANHLAATHGLEISRVTFNNGRLILVPALEPPPAHAASPRRDGTLAERVAALATAEAKAEDARQHGQQLCEPILARLVDGVQRLADRSAVRESVAVAVHRGITAVPPAHRRRAPGVGDDVTYEAGVICVVEHQPQYSHTLVVSAAVQVLGASHVRLHGAVEYERWLPTGNEREEFWRLTGESPLNDQSGVRQADDLISAAASGLDELFDEFDRRRSPG